MGSTPFQNGANNFSPPQVENDEQGHHRKGNPGLEKSLTKVRCRSLKSSVRDVLLYSNQLMAVQGGNLPYPEVADHLFG